MGGNALKEFGIETVRLSRPDYLDLENRVIEKLVRVGINVFKLPFYFSKSSFGDLDAVIEFNPEINYRVEIQHLFNPRKISVNDGVYSFDFENFQVDLICRKSEYLVTTINYLSWNDCNNLIGRPAHSFGVNHGWQGLRFHIRQKLFNESVENSADHIIKTLTLSRNPRGIMEFLGYDYEIYLKGFDTLEEIFLYVTSTPFFNAENFKLENLNHENRTRNRKRPVFMNFVKWMEQHPELDKKFNFGDKKDWIDKIDKKWSIKKEIENERQKYLQNRENSKKFNGNLVRDWTGLNGSKLGKILSSFKFNRNIFSNFKTFSDYLQFSSADTIKQDFLEWFARQSI